MRTENDSLGSLKLDDDCLYGIQSARARENFALGCKPTNIDLVHALVKVKKAAALTYVSLDVKADIYQAVVSACDLVLTGKHDDAFVVDALQGGAGTSTNMNVNEVLANLALVSMGHKPGSYDIIHPLDDVNKGQSTNDVYPTALRIASIEKLRILSGACEKLQSALQNKEQEFDHIAKLGRTELMDAIPITLGQEFGAYGQAIARDRWRLYKVEERLRQVNLGGTAVGVGSNASRKYRFGVIEQLRSITGIGLAVAEYPLDITQNNDVFVEVSGLLKALAVNLMKIANDLRLMNSGPHGGLGEIILKPMQMGSTIMPGKVNPVIPEMVIQVAMKVMANDQAISMACSHGEFELNAFLPLIADSLLENLDILINAVYLFETRCIEGIQPDQRRCQELLDRSFAFAFGHVAKLGYERIASIIEQAGGNPQKAREIIDDLANKKEDQNN